MCDLFEDLPECLAELPPASIIVYLTLHRADEPQTMEDLEDTLPLSHGGIHNSLDRLRETGLVERTTWATEPMTYRYHVTD